MCVTYRLLETHYTTTRLRRGLKSVSLIIQTLHKEFGQFGQRSQKHFEPRDGVCLVVASAAACNRTASSISSGSEDRIDEEK